MNSSSNFLDKPCLTKLPIQAFKNIRALVILVLSISFVSVQSLPAHAEPVAIDGPAKGRLADIFDSGVPATLEDLKAMQDHIKMLAKKVIPCTVGLRLGNVAGSGVLISEDGLVLTAAHVIGKPNVDVTILFHDGSTAKGVSLGANYGVDSGLLRIHNPDKKKYKYLEMGDSARLKQGQWCMATGHPGGYDGNRSAPVRVGRLLINHPDTLTTDCTLVGGDSGGPLFDMAGKVIGIHSRISIYLTSNAHVPVNTFRDTWKRLEAGEAWGGRGGGRRALAKSDVLGIRALRGSDSPYIGRIIKGGLAEQAGLQKGDLIQSFGGVEVKTFKELLEQIDKHPPGEHTVITFIRSSHSQAVRVQIGKARSRL